MKAALIACLALSIPACVDPPDDSDVTNIPKLSANAMTPANLAGENLNSHQLTAANAASMAQNINQRTALQYAVGCALSTSQSITFTVGATNYTYTGTMGVATKWLGGDLDADSAAWISACVLARINQFGTSVTFSMRGSNTGLSTTSSELTNYQIEEGAFWGNVFLDLGTLSANACNGVDQLRNDTYADLPLRECAEWDGVTGSNKSPCGMNYAGACATVCSGSSANYSGCAFNGGTAYTQVATSFLNGLPQ